MCQVIDTACFIANVVSEQPDRDSFTLSELGRARKAVEEALRDSDMVIEWTRSAFLSTMFYYRDFFSKRDETITISQSARQVLTEAFVTEEFNLDLGEAVQRQMRQSIRAAIGTGG